MSVKHRGLAPTRTEIRKRKREGYALASAIAQQFDVAPTTVYGWLARSKLRVPAGVPINKPLSIKERGNLWILIAAVEAHLQPVQQ